MTFLDHVGKEIKVGDFVIYVTAGDRHPVLEFGWVEKFHETKNWNGVSGTKIKFQKSSPNGKRHTVRTLDVGSHWREDTPAHIKDYYSGYRRTKEEYEKYYVPATYRDTGKPATTMLEIIETTDPNEPRYNKRMMVMEPVT